MALARPIAGGLKRGHWAKALAGVPLALETALESERRQLVNWLAVSFALGIALYFGAPVEPPLALGLALSALGALALWRLRRRRLLVTAMALAFFACALGFLAAELRARLVAAPVLTRAYGPAHVEGTVREVLSEKSRARVLVDVVSISGLPARDRPARLRLTLTEAGQDLRPGVRIQARARLMPPPGPAAPGAYDFARGAWFERIGGVGIVFGPPKLLAAPAEERLGRRIGLYVDRLRAAVGARVRTHLAGDVGAVATALINGDRTRISDEINRVFRASGLQHILSISGLHFSMVAFGIYGALRLLLAAIEPAALLYPIKKWAALAALFGSFLYLLLSGAAIPASRSFLMVAIVLLAVLVDRNALTMRNVAIAALVILAIKPESLLNVSFQMSFAAVAALIAAFEARRIAREKLAPEQLSIAGRAAKFLGALALSSLVATAATAPFAVFHFHNFYGYGLPANLVALPVLGVLVMPAATLGLVLMPFGLEGVPLAVMGFGIKLILAVARFVAEWPGAILLVRALPTAAFLAIVAGGLWLCLWQTPWRRWGLVPIAAGAVIALLAVPPSLIVDGEGRHVAVRGEGGALLLLRGSATDFTGTTWLARDADSRVLPLLSGTARTERPKGLQCDSLGCAYRLLSGELLALSDTQASLMDDCARADILIARVPVRGSCPKPMLVIDRFALWRFGAHEVRLKNGTAHVRHVQGARGDRLWSRAKPWRGGNQ